jgi:hypothetical protein
MTSLMIVKDYFNSIFTIKEKREKKLNKNTRDNGVHIQYLRFWKSRPLIIEAEPIH